jgi:hypothetical protein
MSESISRQGAAGAASTEINPAPNSLVVSHIAQFGGPVTYALELTLRGETYRSDVKRLPEYARTRGVTGLTIGQIAPRTTAQTATGTPSRTWRRANIGV